MLINLRNAMLSGKRLPYDAEVEYLQSSGTQWIDTGIIGNERLVIDLIWSYGATDADSSPFGSRLSASSRAIAITGYNQTIDRRLYLNYGSKTNYVSYNGNDLYGHIWEIHVENGNSRLIRDGLVVSTGSASTTAFTTPSSLMLFGLYDNGTMYVSKNMRIHSWSVRDGSTLIQDLIPVRAGTVGYLYDRVSGKLFGNAGTGDFVVGPDVVPVEWLESDGNQYIDTGYVFQFGDDVSATFQPLATSTQTAYFFGADTAYNAGLNVHYDPTVGSTGVRFCYGGGFGTGNSGIVMSPVQAFSTSTIYACNGNANKRTINSGENTASAQDSGLNSASVILFCGRRNANVRPASTGWAIASRFFGFDAKRNGADIRAMKPVRVGTDATSWEGAMMDVLTRRIYRNAGSGAFGYGNDLKYPIPAE